MKAIPILVTFILSATLSFSQNCGNDSFIDAAEVDSYNEYVQLFESELERLIKLKEDNFEKAHDLSGLKTIPVIVHILHAGEALGTGGNIPHSQIESAIDVLNERFDSQFYDQDFSVQFCLAQRDLDDTGLDERGVLRHNYYDVKNMYLEDHEEFEIGDGTAVYNLIPYFILDPTSYFNIVVFDMGWNGLAKLPALSTLEIDVVSPGSVGESDNDAIVVDPDYFGTSATGNVPQTGQYNVPVTWKTLVHEVGHWLGLYHTWGPGGSDNCSTDDYCSDTPFHGSPSRCGDLDGLCATQSPSSSEPLYNIMNYPKTSYDCRWFLTNQQIVRIGTVLENSPRRASLPNSNKCGYPIEIGNPSYPSYFSLSPNPVVNTTSFELLSEDETTNKNVVIRSTTGVIVESFQLNTQKSTYTIDMSSMENGYYTISLFTNETHLETQRLTKM